jgi:hypothetical protein
MDFNTNLINIKKSIERIGEEKFFEFIEIDKNKKKEINPSIIFNKLSKKLEGLNFNETSQLLQSLNVKKITDNLSPNQIDFIKTTISEIMFVHNEALLQKGYCTSPQIYNARILFFGVLKSYYGFSAKECANYFNYSKSRVQIYCKSFSELDEKIKNHKDLLEKYKILIDKIKTNA